MSTSVQTILVGAYNRYSSNDPGKLAQDPELIAHLSRVYLRTWPLLARARVDLFQSEMTVTLAGFPAAAALPPDLLDVTAAFNASGDSVWIIPSNDRNRLWQLAPCVLRAGASLRSRFKAGDPIAGDVLTLTVLDSPPALVNLSDTLDPRWPIRHVQLFVDLLAAYLGVKDAGRSDSDRAALLAELKADSLALAAEFQPRPRSDRVDPRRRRARGRRRMTLHINSFGGGAVVQGSADTRRIDEVLVADSVDIGPRGALIATSDLSDYTVLDDVAAAPAPWSKIHALLAAMPGYSQVSVLAIGEGAARSFRRLAVWRGVPAHAGAARRRSEPARWRADHPAHARRRRAGAGDAESGGGDRLRPVVAGRVVDPERADQHLARVHVGAREGTAPKTRTWRSRLYVVEEVVGSGTLVIQPIGDFNALGTGPLGDGVLLPDGSFDIGDKSQQLFFRGIIAYNNFVFGWGFDSLDTANADGPARMMFCNLGLPLKWGNDNLTTGTPPVPVTGNRLFTDSDAISAWATLARIIRAACRALREALRRHEPCAALHPGLRPRPPL